jgi:hypothetical protein
MSIEDKETYITLSGKSFTKDEFEEFVMVTELNFFAEFFLPVIFDLNIGDKKEPLKCMLN